MIGAGLAAKGGFKLGKALWGMGKTYVQKRIAKAKESGFNLQSGGFSANLAGQPAPAASMASGGPGTGYPDGDGMDWKKFAPIIGVVALLLIMKKK